MTSRVDGGSRGHVLLFSELWWFSRGGPMVVQLSTEMSDVASLVVGSDQSNR